MSLKIFGDLNDFKKNGSQKDFDFLNVWQKILENTNLYLGDFLTTNLSIRSFLGTLFFIEEKLIFITGFIDKNKNQAKEDNIVDELMNFEEMSNGGWKFVLDFPSINGVYGAPVLQFCNGSPRYDRFIITFARARPTFRLETGCVVSALDDLDLVRSFGNISLREAIHFYEQHNCQRIAVLGSARIFPYGLVDAADSLVQNLSNLITLSNNDVSLTKKLHEILNELYVLKELFSSSPPSNPEKSDIENAKERLDEFRNRLREIKISLDLLKNDLANLSIFVFEDDLQEIENKIWDILYTSRAQDELDQFLYAMDESGASYTFLNGGWAGVQENSMGMPMISSLYGIAHDSETAAPCPPITIMPSGGSHDRVRTAIDNTLVSHLSNLICDIIAREEGMLYEGLLTLLEDFFLTENRLRVFERDYQRFLDQFSIFLRNNNLAIDVGIFDDALPDIFCEDGYDRLERTISSTYFEIDGVWGDDSKYLVALSTGLLVFEPYGFWTNIEIANGVAQGRPVAIIADPDKNYDFSLTVFIEQELELPDGSFGTCRIYRNARDAVDWFNEEHSSISLRNNSNSVHISNNLNNDLYDPEYLIAHRHNSTLAQREYDARFGVVARRSTSKLLLKTRGASK